jgi:hypothetical protein
MHSVSVILHKWLPTSVINFKSDAAIQLRLLVLAVTQLAVTLTYAILTYNLIY